MRTLLRTIKDHADASRSRTQAPGVVHSGGTGPERVLRLLHTQDKRDEKGRGGTKIIHASSTIKLPLCARNHYLMHVLRQEGYTFPETPWGSMRLVWAYGRAAEKHVRDTLLLDPQMKRDAYGVWACKCGHTKVRGRYSPGANACPKCSRKPENYREITFIDSDAGVSGNPDFAYWDETAYRVVEIKSIKGKHDGVTQTNEVFQTIEAPLPNHVNQGCHYVKMFQREGLQVHAAPLILYVSKGFEQRVWYKGFIPEGAALQRGIDATRNQRTVTREYREALAAGRCPGKISACVENPGAKTKSCPSWAECMARE